MAQTICVYSLDRERATALFRVSRREAKELVASRAASPVRGESGEIIALRLRYLIRDERPSPSGLTARIVLALAEGKRWAVDHVEAWGVGGATVCDIGAHRIHA